MALRTPLTAQPHLYIGDSTGRPLDYGRVYFGEPNKDPEFYPIDIYLDPEMTIAAAQPVRTKGGFMDVGGNLAELHAAEVIYSLKVLDQYGRQVFYKPEMYRNNVSDFLVDEITRATSAETLIAGNLTTETQRAVAAEKVIADAVVTEKDRAVAAEVALDGKYSSLSTTINSLGGGKKAYTTYALMVADKNNIAANSSIDVTNDTDPLKNSTYSYDGAVFAKSIYDPLTLAKADATTKADAALATAKTYSNETSEHSGSNFLDSNQDSDGIIYAYTEKDGKKHLAGLDGSIQDNFASVNARVSYNPSGSDAAQVLDKNGELMLGLTADSTLLVNDLVTSQGSINDFMLNGKSGETANVNLGEVYNNLDGYHSAKDEPINEIHTLADAVDFAGYFSNFAPDIVQIGKNQFYLVFELRDTGDDYGEMKIMGRKLTYSPATRAIELGDYVEIATNGDTETGVPYVYINACVTYVERGNHAGRIYVHCNYMTNPTVADDRVYKPYYMYSDDGGVSFTAPISMASMIPDYDVNVLWVASPCHGIQLNHGEFKDRLVITAYTIHPDAPAGSLGWGALTLVSDDGGDTWQRGAYLDIVGLNETQVAELPDGRVVIVARHYSWRDYAYIAYSSDGGLTFDSPKLIDGVLGAGTKKGLVSCDNSFNYALPKLVLVSASDETGSAEGRVNPCIWASYDGGETWTDKKQIAVGICQYTDVVPLDEDHVLVVWGGGTLRDGDKILASVVNTKFIIGRT